MSPRTSRRTCWSFLSSLLSPRLRSAMDLSWDSLIIMAAMLRSYEQLGLFYLGRRFDLGTNARASDPVLYESRDLVTHAVCIGMTGSGKTGLGITVIEEAALDQIPVLAIDPKGDLSNLLLTFPDLAPGDFAPWVDERQAQSQQLTREAAAGQVAARWKKGLAEWDQDRKSVV